MYVVLQKPRRPVGEAKKSVSNTVQLLPAIGFGDVYALFQRLERLSKTFQIKLCVAQSKKDPHSCISVGEGLQKRKRDRKRSSHTSEQ